MARKVEIDPNLPLENLKWEAFAQGLSAGHAIKDAYVMAGFAPDTKNAAKLAKRPPIAARVHALLSPVMQRFAVSRERWVREVAALSFSDIGDLMTWRTETETDVDNDDGGEVLVIKHIHSHKGTLIDSETLSPEKRATIQSVKVKADGEIEIKLHPKLGALRLLGESLRVIGRHQQQDGDGNDVPASDKTASETVDELRALFERSFEEHEQRAANARLIEGTATEEPG